MPWERDPDWLYLPHLPARRHDQGGGLVDGSRVKATGGDSYPNAALEGTWCELPGPGHGAHGAHAMQWHGAASASNELALLEETMPP